METGDEEIRTRIASYEMFMMQSSAPELIDICGNPSHSGSLWRETGQASFANNSPLASIAERGTRFVQLYYTNWDHHGAP